MRIVLVSYAANGFAVLHRTCERAGHTPVAYLHARSLRPRGPARGGAGETVAGIVDALPDGVDLLLPGRTGALAASLRAQEADLLVCYGCPWRFPAAALAATRLGALNVHTSLLPRYRGPLPIHWAVRNGDPETGVTVHWMDERFDTGNVLVQEGGVRLPDDVVPAVLFDEVDRVIGRLLPTALERAAAGDPGEPQDSAGASYAGWWEPSFSTVDWGWPARRIHDQVRALRFGSSGRSGPRARLDGARVTVLRTSLMPAPGVEVACGDGPLWVTEFTSDAEPDEHRLA
ncbi:methionyl-tRNA formyltransferase [Streptomyces sp. LE64]|uniref:methionyl-tRNA formyltransferase n=1 Tax=Streptomyces sp. LE64 TaxID=3448653 RepID=UPI0040420038